MSGYPWSADDLAPGTCRQFDFGPLRVWIRRTRTTWQFASTYVDKPDATVSDGSTPEDLEWTIVVPRSNGAQVLFQPAPPDRPVVVHTEQPFQLTPASEYTLYTEVPLWVRAWIGGPRGQLLFDLPTVTLSNTWFGGAMTGRLCYTSPNIFARDTSTFADSDHHALCSLHVRNSSDHPFAFRKLAILADLLHIYRSSEHAAKPPRRRLWRQAPKPARVSTVTPVPGQLWTADAYAHYSAEQELNVSVADTSPIGGPGFEVLCEPRERSSDNIFKRSIILLRRISNYE